MTFEVRTKTGKHDVKKTDRLKKQMDQACDTIMGTVIKEVSAFRKLAQKYDVEDSFWIAACHRAMLTLHKDGMDIYLSAEFGDFFGSPDLTEPVQSNKWLDIERVQSIKEKYDKKQNTKVEK